jgi:hypothetical protein
MKRGAEDTKRLRSAVTWISGRSHDIPLITAASQEPITPSCVHDAAAYEQPNASMLSEAMPLPDAVQATNLSGAAGSSGYEGQGIDVQMPVRRATSFGSNEIVDTQPSSSTRRGADEFYGIE